MIPKTSKLKIVEKPSYLGIQSKMVDIIESLKIMAPEMTIETSLEECGYKTLTGLRSSLRNAAKKAGIDDARIKAINGKVYIYNK